MRGSENDKLGQIFYSTSHFIDFSVVMYLFMDDESIYESSKKIRPSVFVKMAIMCQIKAGGAFCHHAQMRIRFCVFLNVRYKLTLVEAYSENLSI